ncbi:hypothetical protein IF188_02205 [Microbacterium sp. NEAU-LLC]|uniref:Glycosyltransferase RgtA/B/C/D-like domain-containing protein n=1 Tax=Microbacterium helvum TaxID=2773713 RepID=A0ABR8NN94_9MICO|nr:hypothetical protein [Microbacterium helvum]MBD3940511.1 hypothetical protein [Microbacterium helvum]
MSAKDTAAGIHRELRVRAASIGLVATVLLVVAAIAIPLLTGWDVRAGSFAPLHSILVLRVGPGTPAAILLAVAAVAFAPRVVRWPWRRLLVAVYGYGVAWMLALATVYGLDGVGAILDHRTEYLETARTVTDIGATLRDYIAHIPLDSEANWPVHLAGHPPGALLFFVVLVRIGLGSALAAGVVITLIAGSTALAVMATALRLGGETFARRAAPFLAVGPAAIWMCVSADAMFAAVAAWATLLLTVAATSRRTTVVVLAGVGSGILYGYCVMLSYGLPLLGILAITVLVLTRSWRPLPFAVVGAMTVVGVFAWAGFAWWEALPVLRDRYWAGIASDRPGAYWTWANLAAVAVCAGPWVGAGLGVAVVDARARGDDPRSRARRRIAFLALAGLAMCVAATLSQMSRAEVERIWLPFVPWMLLATGLLPERWRRSGLIVQVAFAIVVQTLLYTRW